MTIHTDIQLNAESTIRMRVLDGFGVVYLSEDAPVYPANADQCRTIARTFTMLAEAMDAIALMAKGTAADPDAPSFPTRPATGVRLMSTGELVETRDTDPAATTRFEATLQDALHSTNLLMVTPPDRTDHLEHETDCDQRDRQDQDDRWGVTR